ncbi:MAG: hypothetical protein MUE33_04565 [Cytophagaceae bacterium]|jgi:hypothetical protein|nr:hypothetical protein [Cytophagaceae bacterium]
MKKVLIALTITTSILAGFALSSFTKKTNAGYEYMQITAVESVVPMGLGRSRLIASTPAGALEEIKLENFFSAAGINFGNIRFNDKTVTDRIEQLTNDGWELQQVNSGVYSGNDNNSSGIFITRYILRRAK